MSVTKKKREKPCKPRGVNSKGINGAIKHPLAPIERVLAGRGLFAALDPVECKSAWMGARDVSDPPFDREQIAVNKRLYPHLFAPERRR